MPEDRHNQVLIGAKQSKTHMDTLYQIYADNSIMPIEFWEDICIHDLHITAEEAIALGLADEIIPYSKRGSYRRSRSAKMKHASKKEKEIKSLVKSLYQRTNRKHVKKIKIEVKQEEFDIDNSVVYPLDADSIRLLEDMPLVNKEDL